MDKIRHKTSAHYDMYFSQLYETVKTDRLYLPINCINKTIITTTLTKTFVHFLRFITDFCNCNNNNQL